MQQKARFDIDGMTCQACASRIEKVLNKKDFINEIQSLYGYDINEETLQSLLININFNFIREGYDNIRLENGSFSLGSNLISALGNDTFNKFFADSIDYSIAAFNESFSKENYLDGLIR